MYCKVKPKWNPFSELGQIEKLELANSFTPFQFQFQSSTNHTFRIQSFFFSSSYSVAFNSEYKQSSSSSSTSMTRWEIHQNNAPVWLLIPNHPKLTTNTLRKEQKAGGRKFRMSHNSQTTTYYSCHRTSDWASTSKPQTWFINLFSLSGVLTSRVFSH